MPCDKYHRSLFHFFVRAMEKTCSHWAEGEIFFGLWTTDVEKIW